MNNETKMITVFTSLMVGVFSLLFGIVSTIEFFKIQERCTYLEKQIEQQTMLIEYLKENK